MFKLSEKDTSDMNFRTMYTTYSTTQYYTLHYNTNSTVHILHNTVIHYYTLQYTPWYHKHYYTRLYSTIKIRSTYSNVLYPLFCLLFKPRVNSAKTIKTVRYRTGRYLDHSTACKEAISYLINLEFYSILSVVQNTSVREESWDKSFSGCYRCFSQV